MELSIEAASDEPGLALSRDGDVLLSVTWQTQQNHSKELLPNVERLLNEARTDKSALTAVFVDIGPGGYAALRVGVSTAKALAHALTMPVAGVGRLGKAKAHERRLCCPTRRAHRHGAQAIQSGMLGVRARQLKTQKPAFTLHLLRLKLQVMVDRK